MKDKKTRAEKKAEFDALVLEQMMKDLEFDRKYPGLHTFLGVIEILGLLCLMVYCLVSGHGRAIVLDILFYGFLAYVFYWLYTRGGF